MDNQPQINIDYRHDGLAKRLSNLFPREFTFDGVECRSMEGLLQSFKIQDESKQKEFCRLYGMRAKMAGKGIPWWEDQTLWWKGEPYYRQSNEYQDLLMDAYAHLFARNKDAHQDLIDSHPARLIHLVGHTNPTETILTRNEFCSILMNIRTVLLQIKMVEF